MATGTAPVMPTSGAAAATTKKTMPRTPSRLLRRPVPSSGVSVSGFVAVMVHSSLRCRGRPLPNELGQQWRSGGAASRLFATERSTPGRLHCPHERTQRVPSAADAEGDQLARAADAVVLLRHPAHGRVPHRSGERPGAAARTTSSWRRKSRAPWRSSGRTGRAAARAAWNCSTRCDRSTWRRSSSCAAPTRARSTAAASRSGSPRTSRSRAAGSRATRRSSATCTSPASSTTAGATPRLEAGAKLGASLAAYDHRLACAVVTLREPAESNGFVNGHRMLHSRFMPSITKDAGLSFDQLVTMGSTDADLGQAWRGDAELELADSPWDELASILPVEEHPRRLLPRARRHLRGWRPRHRPLPSHLTASSPLLPLEHAVRRQRWRSRASSSPRGTPAAPTR